MEKSKTLDGPQLEPEGSASTSAAASETSAKQQNQRADGRRAGPEEVLIHGLSVERYRVIYNSVLQPAALAALSSAKNTDYVCQVLELKERLWTHLGRPRLQETVMEDGRVEVTEILDLT